MLFVSSPFRVSLVGGGSDYEDYFKIYGGRTISFAIDQGCLISFNQSSLSSCRFRLAYSAIEECNHVSEIAHPMLGSFLSKGTYNRLEVHYDATLPKGTGLGTSSAFACCLVAADRYTQGKSLDPYMMAREAIELERYLMNEQGGWQDQIISSYGGICDIVYSGSDFRVSRLMPSEYSLSILNQSMYLFVSLRKSGNSGLEAANRLRNDQAKRIAGFSDLYCGVAEGLSSGNIGLLKECLYESFRLKQEFTPTHSSDTQALSNALESKKMAHKVCGSGNGGAVFVICDESDKRNLETLLDDKLISSRFSVCRISISMKGTSLITPFSR